MIRPLAGNDKIGFLNYGCNSFNTKQIKSIERGHILVPQGDTWQEGQAREAADLLVKNLNNPEKADDVKYYAMLCDAVHRDFPNSPVRILMDKNDRAINATHITGIYGSKLAVVPSALASYEEVVQSVGKSVSDFPAVVDIAG